MKITHGQIIISALLLVAIIAVASITSAYATNPPTDNLQLWWKFDENTGTSAYDSSPNGRTGTLTNGTTWVSGHSNYATQYAPASKQVTQRATDTSLSMNLKSFSVCSWFNTTVTTDGYYFIYNYGGLNVAGTYKLFLQALGSGTYFYVQFGMPYPSAGYVQSVNGAGTYNNGQWHLACGTFDNSTLTEKIYVDNVLSNTVTTGGSTGAGTGPVTVGGECDSTPTCASRYFNGGIDEVMVYDRVLQPVDINNIFFYSGTTTTTSTTSSTTSSTTTSSATTSTTSSTTSTASSCTANCTITGTISTGSFSTSFSSFTTTTLTSQVTLYVSNDAPIYLFSIAVLLISLVTFPVIFKTKTLVGMFMAMGTGIIWAIVTTVVGVIALYLLIGLALVGLFFRIRGKGT